MPTPPETHAPAPLRPTLSHARTYITSDTLIAFRSLALSHSRDLRKVAVSVGGYVDAVAKERERERERIRREREVVSQSPRLAHATSGPAAATGHEFSIPTPGFGSSGSTVSVASASQEAPTSQAIPQSSPQEVRQPSPPPTKHRPPLPAAPAPPLYATPPEEHRPGTALFVKEETIINAMRDSASVERSLAEQPASAAPFDSFVAMDGVWSQNSDFIMDLGMDFNMNVSSVSEVAVGGQSNPMDVDVDGFGVFTDDDFNFFDGPARPLTTATVPPPPEHVNVSSETGLTPAAGPAPLGFSPPYGVGLHLSGAGPSSITPGHSHPSPWVPSVLTEAFETPRFTSMHGHDGDTPPAPELMPPSPTKSTSTHSDPLTPTVQFAAEADVYTRKPLLDFKSTIFTPIPFAQSHRISDDKYVMGKFALPSPPDEEDRTEYFVLPTVPDMPSWKRRYTSVTDPRVAVVKKLIGVKRKIVNQGVREAMRSPKWTTEHEEWSSSIPIDPVEDVDAKSEPESEDNDPWIEEEDDPLLARPSTPLPLYLPLGPALLPTHFLHSKLLPMSTNLRPPGSAFAVTDMPSSVSNSVPTPVSPAAVLGAASERTKSLEAAVQILSREVVENSLWAEAWRINSLGQSLSWKHAENVWQLDVQCVGRLIEGVQALDSPLDINQLLSIGERG